MGTLADLSSQELIVPTLRGPGADSAIAELSEALESAGRVPDARTLVEAVHQREALSSTACSPGWAVPHARMPGLLHFSLAVGRSDVPLIWFGAAEPVRLVFLFAVPEVGSGIYLSAVSALARLSQDSGRAGQLLRARDRASIFNLLAEVPLRSPRSVLRPLAVAR